MEEQIQKNAAEAAKAQNNEQQGKPQRKGTRRPGDNFLDAIYKFETSYPGGITADTLFDERTERIVKGQADALIVTGLFPQHERDDIQQILRLALMHEMSNYDPTRDRYSFAANVCANYGKNLITKRSQEWARTNGPLVSLETPLDGGDTLGDMIEAADSRRAELRAAAVARLLRALSESDRAICEVLLDGLNIRQTAKRLRVSRTTIIYRIGVVIRAKADECGIADLKKEGLL